MKHTHLVRLSKHEEIWFHSHRYNVINRIYALEDKQIATLLLLKF